MISTLAWVPFLLLLVVVQKTILDIFSFHMLSIELSLLFVVYAGFYMGVLKGGILTLLAGFLVGTLTGTVSGLFMFIYITVFCLASLVSARVYIEQPHLIMIFTFCCALLEGAMLVAISHCFLEAPALHPLIQAVMPQVFILSLISPLFFRLFRRFEVMVHAETLQTR
ncbi:MAG: hypothetical protein JW902_15000 [Syntrophaceae bacterium]|nr:hypothetical protein [Syntrophaceae bacterium]